MCSYLFSTVLLDSNDSIISKIIGILEVQKEKLYGFYFEVLQMLAGLT